MHKKIFPKSRLEFCGDSGVLIQLEAHKTLKAKDYKRHCFQHFSNSLVRLEVIRYSQPTHCNKEKDLHNIPTEASFSPTLIAFAHFYDEPKENVAKQRAYMKEEEDERYKGLHQARIVRILCLHLVAVRRNSREVRGKLFKVGRENFRKFACCRLPKKFEKFEFIRTTWQSILLRRFIRATRD